MNMIHRIEFPVTTNDVDCFCRLKAASILNMLQDAAGSQCAGLHLSWEELAEKGLFWAVIRQRLQILRSVGPGETVTVETWPGITTRVAYPRSSIGYDSRGNEIFRAISLWVLVDLKSRTMVLPGKSGVELTGICRGCELPSPGSIGMEKLENLEFRTVRFSELDRNGHMSNTRYLDWMADLLSGEFHREHRLADVTVNYLSEAREGEQILLTHRLEDGTLHLQAAGPEGHRVFAVRAQYEKL